MQIYRLENAIQTYAWGSKTAIADLLGQPSPAEKPQAELWMGTHPKGPSMVIADGDRIPLQQLIDQQPVDILGNDVAMRFGNTLPYLFKVLAAARPLSIQAHPSKHQAVEGFSRENREGKALAAPDRNYRDDNHKPEVICALTPFWGLNGFRSAAAVVDLLAPVCPQLLEDAFEDLKNRQGGGVRKFFKAMMTLSADKRQAAAQEVLDKANPWADRSPVYRWMVQLARAYPADMGVLSPALLNLRGGLTPKHVDVPELLRVVKFVETSVKIIDAGPVRPAESGYDCPAEEFSLTVIRTTKGQPYFSPSKRSVEMLLCTAGEGRLDDGGQGEILTVKKGDSFLVPAGLDPYAIRGNVALYKAAVPLPRQ
ncbi:MAG: mannose-6-phosphate isomerase, class I [Desulfosarcina sp.]|nr:mannose-6-phosphate isomerase, class I [Desulfosarcina sp.]